MYLLMFEANSRLSPETFLSQLGGFCEVARIFGLGGLISAEVWAKHFRSENKIRPVAGSFNWS